MEKKISTHSGSDLWLIWTQVSSQIFMLIENILRLTRRRIYLQEHIKIDIPSVKKQTRSDRMCKKTKIIFRSQKDSDRIVQRGKAEKVQSSVFHHIHNWKKFRRPFTANVTDTRTSFHMSLYVHSPRKASSHMQRPFFYFAMKILHNFQFSNTSETKWNICSWMLVGAVMPWGNSRLQPPRNVHATWKQRRCSWN